MSKGYIKMHNLEKDLKDNILELNAFKETTETELPKKADTLDTYTKAEIIQKMNDIIGSAPEALDTLKEIADALNNDPSFATTIVTELAKKADKTQVLTNVPANAKFTDTLTPVVDSLDSSSTTSALSANKGRELFQSVSNGKQVVATAITGKGVTTSGSAEFSTMATNIGKIITDPTGDATAIAGDIISGKTAYSKGSKLSGTLSLSGNAVAGNVVSGTTFYSTDPKTKLTGTLSLTGNAPVANVLAGSTFYTTNPTSKLPGTMVNRGTVTNTITAQNGSYTIPIGYHSGTGKVTATFANLIAGNIKSGVNIGGVVGNMPIGAQYATGSIITNGLTTVSGLNFTPKYIIISGTYSDDYGTNYVIWAYPGRYDGIRVEWYGSNSGSGYKRPITITSNGFTFTDNNRMSMTWFACNV